MLPQKFSAATTRIEPVPPLVPPAPQPVTIRERQATSAIDVILTRRKPTPTTYHK